MSGDEIARLAGCHRSQVYERLKKNAVFIEEMAAFTRTVTAATLAEQTARIKKKFEDMYEKAVDVVDETLGDTDDKRLRYSAAKDMIDHIRGRATQRIEQSGQVTNVHRVEVVALPSEDLKFLTGAIKGTRALLTGAPPPEEEVIDVEIVDGSVDEPTAGSE